MKIKKVGMFLIITGCLYYVTNKMIEEIRGKKKEINKLNEYVDLLIAWNKNISGNKKLTYILEKYNFKDVIIYGNGKLGKLLYEEIKDEINVLSFIDHNIGNGVMFKEKVPVFSIDSEKGMTSKSDLVIITPIYDFDQIYLNLVEKDIANYVVGLDDLVYENLL